MVRIDAYVALLALVAVAAVLLAVGPVGARAATGRQVGALLVAAIGPAWIGWADVAWLSNGYYHDERTHILAADRGASSLFAVVGAIGGRCSSWRPPVRAWVVGAAGALPGRRDRRPGRWWSAFAFLASRPLWLVAHGGGLDLYLEQVQRAGRQPGRHHPHLRRAVGELAGALLRLADRGARGRRLRVAAAAVPARARLRAARLADHGPVAERAVPVVARRSPRTRSMPRVASSR